MQKRFADALRRQLERRGWTQSALARALGVDHSLVSHWLAGRRNPRRETVRKLADVFELTGPERAQFFAAAGYVEFPDE